MTPLVLCSAIAIVAILGMLFLSIQTIRNLSQANQESRQTILTLSKLAASKDIAAFHGLESAPGPYESTYPIQALDDESIARNMMQRYAEQGIDPNFALSPDSDPLQEFGGKESFL